MKKVFIFIFSVVFSMGLMAETVIADFSSMTSTSKLADFPAGWTYITNNISYPNPNYGASNWKLAYYNSGCASPKITAGSLTLNINVQKLNQNTKKGIDNAPIFYITTYLNNDSVGLDSIMAVEVGDNITTLGVQGDSVRIIFNTYPYDGTAYCNIAVSKIELTSTDVSSSVENTTIKKPAKMFIKDNQILISDDKNVYTITGQLNEKY